MSVASKILSASAKPSDKKRVLTAANYDTINFNQVINWVNTSDIDFSVTLSVEDLPYGEIFNVGEFNSPDTGLFRMVNFGTNQIIIWIYQKNSVSTIDGAVIPLPYGSKGVVTVLNREIRLDGNLVYTLGEHVLDIDMNGTTRKAIIGSSMDTPEISSKTIYECSLDSESYYFNEGNNFTSIGSNGSIATGQTSSADPVNYWNQNVIKTI